MKTFLKKLFYLDAPAQGAFAGTTLLFTSLWLGPALFLLCGGEADWTPRQLFRGENLPLVFLWLPLVMLLYWLILFIRFHRSEILRRKPKWNSPGMLVCFAVLIPTLAAALLLSQQNAVGYGFCLLLILPVWAMPPASLPEQWKCWLVRGLCWTGAFLCAIHFLKCLRLTWNYEWFFGFSLTTCRDGNYSPGKDLLIVYLGVILFLAGYLLSAKMYAAAAGIRFRKIFGLPVKITLGIWVVVYLISGAMAVVRHRAADRTASELGAFFGYPLNAAGVNALLRKTGWSDWVREKDRRLEYQLNKSLQRYVSHPYLWVGNAVLPEAVRKQWRTEIEQLQPLKTLELELEKPFQPGFIPSKDGSAGTASNYHFIFSKFCGFEQWKIIFLLEENKLPEALKTLRRMENAIEYFRRNPVNMHDLVWHDAQCRLNAMELLLADGRVPDSELKRWSADLEQREKEIPERERLSICIHAVRINDLFYRFAHGYHSLPLYPLRWLYPPVWYYAELDRQMSLSRFRHNRYTELPCSDYKFGIGRFYSNLPVQFMTRYSRTLTAKYRAMRALIGVELEKRCTGRYPDTLENPPTDPFTGKPMFYKKGKMPLIVKVWNPALQRLVPELREADGIAIWSLGWNRKNEQGQDQSTLKRYADDVRAKMIFKTGSRE